MLISGAARYLFISAIFCLFYINLSCGGSGAAGDDGDVSKEAGEVETIICIGGICDDIEDSLLELEAFDICWTCDSNPEHEVGEIEEEIEEEEIETVTPPVCEPCETNDDCNFGFCLEYWNGKCCNKPCFTDESCSPTERCILVPHEPDPVWTCVPISAKLCQPCKEDSECTALFTGKKGICIDYGNEGKFCGSWCEEDSDCESGFTCSEVSAPRVGSIKQCVMKEGICKCNEKHVKNKYTTLCYVENDYGKCAGETYCADVGIFAPCSAIPAEPEKCDNIDNNCDNFTDNDVPSEECILEGLYGKCQGKTKCINGKTECFGDPAIPEICDDIDNNCNGQTDEEEAQGCLFYYRDNDGDGSASKTDKKCLCDPEGEYKYETGNDCDDNIKEINPNAEEICNEIDDNCNNFTDEENATNCVVYYKDEDQDGYGIIGDKKCLCKPTLPYTSLLTGDCNDSVFAVNPGASEQCNLLDDNCNNQIDEEGALLCTNYYYDFDKDKYGVAGDLKCLCAPFEPYVAIQGGDCDDFSSLKNPGQLEKCNGYDDNCDTIIDPQDSLFCTKYCIDSDKDGHGVAADNKCLCQDEEPYTILLPLCQGDCDDNNPDIGIDGVEVCGDNLDNNCNGYTDEENGYGCVPFFFDGDQDGFGVEGNSKCLCTPQGKYSTQKSGDCNDNDTSIYPGAVEKCNQKDDNCDTVIDEENAAECTEYYYDGDDDGSGDCNKKKCLCSPWQKYKAEACGDCNDADKTVNPGALEICANNKDDNCNGSQNDEGAYNCKTFFEDKDNDGFGVAGSTKCLCYGEGNFTASVGGDCDDNDSAIKPGATEVCNGKDDNCDNQTDPEGTNGCGNFYYDNDGDGYGLSGNFKCLCSPNGKYTAQSSGDCNDNNLNVNPGISEACNSIDDNCNNATDEENADGCKDYYYNNDNDAYGVTSDKKCLCSPSGKHNTQLPGDCNDNDNTIYPNASEKCNGKDDNCDNDIDEAGAVDCTTYYYDGDQDTFGVKTNTKCQCYPLAPYSASDYGDCNDSNNAINPEAIESCNSVDDNCNSQTDEAGASGCSIYYFDEDDDSFGVTTNSACLCSKMGYYRASAGGDCNDSNKEINPAKAEKCNGMDDNCNTQQDEENAIGCVTYYYNNDNDSYGVNNNFKCLCIISGKYNTNLAGDCNDNDSSIFPNATENCNAKDDDCDGVTDEDVLSGCSNYFYDYDKDGFGVSTDYKCLCAAEGYYTALEGGDCNDFNKEIKPNASEKCNGIDDNCDELIDGQNSQGCVNYYYDFDSDNYGVTYNNKCLCSPQGKYNTTNGGDCNDSNANVKPGAVEKCNSIDDNCDAVTDDENSEGCQIYYFDNDGDGFGVQSNSKCLCGPSGRYSTQSTVFDCNDNNQNANPNAVEKCNGYDDNCDTVIDGDNSDGCNWYYFDDDLDGYGLDSKKKCLCAQSGKYTALSGGDCDDTNGSVKPNTVEKCNGYDDNCDGLVDAENSLNCTAYYLDNDKDNFGVTGIAKCLCLKTGKYTAEVDGDCNDNSATIYPGASEICNSVDDNCNWLTDEEGAQNCSNFYYDNDIDSYGVETNYKCLCAGNDKYTAPSYGDCNDNSATIYPGASEKCNSVDDNCNGIVDEENAVDGSFYYYDGDGDNYGKMPADKKKLCGPTGKYTSANATDCDDTKYTVNPGATEICANSIDDNCNNQTDEAGCGGCITYYYDNDSDGYGVDGNTQCLSAPSGKYTADKGGDCNDFNSQYNPGMTEACDGADNNCNGSTDEEGATGCTNFFFDFDNDNYGKTTEFKCYCASTGNYRASQGGDCDDNNNQVKPGATEACNGYDDNCDSFIDGENSLGCSTYFYDNDSDGWGVSGNTKCLCTSSGKYTATVGGDCNDNDPAIGSGGNEDCSTPYDDDCDNVTNEKDASNCTQFFFDFDGDGYGSSQYECWCAAQGNYKATLSGDCNDSNAFIRPGATEKCNGLDDNCDGVTDPENAPDCANYYYDNDGDSYGLTDNYKCLCAPSGKYTAQLTGDCNDNNSNINPSKIETCNTFDDNCDGVTDTENSQGCAIYYYDNDADNYGVVSSSKCLCAKGGKYTATQYGDCNDNNSAISPGAKEVCNGYDDDCDNSADEGTATDLCGDVPNAQESCTSGQCIILSCSLGYYNVDNQFINGCECQIDATEGPIEGCSYAIDLGNITDNSGVKISRSGNILPGSDSDWYRFTAVDMEDAGSLGSPAYDKFHVRVRFLYPVSNNPFKFEVYKGSSCQEVLCSGAQDYQWYTNYQSGSYPNLIGESPCMSVPNVLCYDGFGNPTGAPECNNQNMNYCEDNGATYVVRIYRGSGSAANCDETQYTVEFSNGAYTP